DVNTTGRDLGFAFADLWSGERDKEQRQRQPAQLRQDRPGARTRDAGDAAHQLHRRIQKGGLKADLALQPGQQRQQQQQKQETWMCEGHGVVSRSLSLVVCCSNPSPFATVSGGNGGGFEPDDGSAGAGTASDRGWK